MSVVVARRSVHVCEAEDFPGLSFTIGQLARKEGSIEGHTIRRVEFRERQNLKHLRNRGRPERSTWPIEFWRG